jgi:hypothetical protein
MVLWPCAHAEGPGSPNAFLVDGSNAGSGSAPKEIPQLIRPNRSLSITPETLDRVVDNQSSRVCSYGALLVGQPSLPIVQVHLYNDIDAGEPP